MYACQFTIDGETYVVPEPTPMQWQMIRCYIGARAFRYPVPKRLKLLLQEQVRSFKVEVAGGQD